MITTAMLGLMALWFAVLYRFPAYFIPRKAASIGGENWIAVLPDHEGAFELQEVA